MSTTHRVFETSKLIRFHHCDPAGIVFYPQYFVLFNELVEDWFNHGLKVDFADFHQVDRMGVPMRKLECEFLAPSQVGETLTMRLRVARLGTSSLTLDVAAERDGVARVHATLVVVLVSLETRRAIPVPDALRAAIQPYAA